MASFVEVQQHLADIINSLIALDYKASSTYDSAAERIDNPFYRRQLRQFCEDHQQHIIALKPHAGKLCDHVVSESGVSEILTRSRVALANWAGDHAILTALLALEEETSIAVAEALRHAQLSAPLRMALEKVAQDEARHKEWIERVLNPDALAGVPVEV